MAHRYKVYDIDGAGNRHEKAVIEVDVLPNLPRNGPSSPDLEGSVVADLCKQLFSSPAAPDGFTVYTYYWRLRRPRTRPYKENDIEIYYTYDEKTHFFLERGG